MKTNTLFVKPNIQITNVTPRHTVGNHIGHVCLFLVRHKPEDRENDKARVETGTAVDNRYDQRVSKDDKF